MALKVELKAGERVIIGTAVIRNGDARAQLFIEGQAPILRERDIFTPATADTPAKKIYLAVQLMYLDGDLSQHDHLYFPLVRDFIQAAPSAIELIAEINHRILGGDLYRALKAARKLIAYEAELITDATRGERLHQGRPGDALAARARGGDPDEGGDAPPGAAR